MIAAHGIDWVGAFAAGIFGGVVIALGVVLGELISWFDRKRRP